MGLKVISNGSTIGTRILDAETGEDLTTRMGAREVRIVLTADEPPRLEVDVIREVIFDGSDVLQVYMACPVTGQRRAVRRIEFEDGGQIEVPFFWAESTSTKQIDSLS